MTYVTTGQRRIASLFLGALLGAVVMTLPVVAMIHSREKPADLATDFVYSFILCGLAWLVGVAAFAFPIWRLVEKRGRRMGWRTAMVFGLVLAPVWFVVVMLLLQGLFESGYDPTFWLGAMGFALIIGAVLSAVRGCIVALAMWRFAYRPAITAGRPRTSTSASRFTRDSGSRLKLPTSSRSPSTAAALAARPCPCVFHKLGNQFRDHWRQFGSRPPAP